MGSDHCFRSATTKARPISTTGRIHPTDFYLPRAASAATVGGRAVMMTQREAGPGCGHMVTAAAAAITSRIDWMMVGG